MMERREDDHREPGSVEIPSEGAFGSARAAPPMGGRPARKTVDPAQE